MVSDKNCVLRVVIQVLDSLKGICIRPTNTFHRLRDAEARNYALASKLYMFPEYLPTMNKKYGDHQTIMYFTEKHWCFNST